MIVACEFCGSIRFDNGQWIESDLEAPRCATCPKCAERRKADAEKRYWDGVRETRKKAATPGALDEYAVDDPFKGFREP